MSIELTEQCLLLFFLFYTFAIAVERPNGRGDTPECNYGIALLFN